MIFVAETRDRELNSRDSTFEMYDEYSPEDLILLLLFI